jgi:hypothetical protein
MPRLFQCSTLARDCFEIKWCCTLTQIPTTRPDGVIDYASTPKDRIGALETVVNELLTESEVPHFREYLESKDYANLQVKEITLPLAVDTEPMQSLPLGEGRGVYRLCDEPDYPFDLPPIVGYFDLCNS